MDFAEVKTFEMIFAELSFAEMYLSKIDYAEMYLSKWLCRVVRHPKNLIILGVFYNRNMVVYFKLPCYYQSKSYIFFSNVGWL